MRGLFHILGYLIPTEYTVGPVVFLVSGVMEIGMAFFKNDIIPSEGLAHAVNLSARARSSSRCTCAMLLVRGKESLLLFNTVCIADCTTGKALAEHELREIKSFAHVVER